MSKEYDESVLKFDKRAKKLSYVKNYIKFMFMNKILFSTLQFVGK